MKRGKRGGRGKREKTGTKGKREKVNMARRKTEQGHLLLADTVPGPNYERLDGILSITIVSAGR